MKFSKLDRFLKSNAFVDRWSSLAVVALDRKLSDHCPIVMKNSHVDFGPKPLNFFDVWLDDVECDSIVANACIKPVFSKTPDAIFQDKLKNVKQDLKVWSKAKFGNCEVNIKKHLEDYRRWEGEAEMRQLNEDERNRWKQARKEWVKEDNWRNQMLKQKARVKWVVEGDENSSFFHTTVRRKVGRNGVKGLLVDGEWCEDPRKIKEETFDYFKSIFKEIDYEIL